MRFKSTQRKPVQPELAASRDESRPVLTKIHLDAEKGQVVATDSYMLVRFPVEVEDGDTSGPIPVAALKAARKPPLKSAEGKIRANSHVEVVMDGKGGEDSAPYVTLPREEFNYSYPDADRLFPANLAEFEIGLNAEALAKIQKALGASYGVRLRFAADDEGNLSSLRPIVVRPLSPSEEDGDAILMPIRLSR